MLLQVVLHKTTQQYSEKITDNNGKPIELVNIAIMGLPGGTTTNEQGRFELNVPANKEIKIVVSFIGFKTQQTTMVLSPGIRKKHQFFTSRNIN